MCAHNVCFMKSKTKWWLMNKKCWLKKKKKECGMESTKIGIPSVYANTVFL